MSDHATARRRHGGDAGHRRERILVSDPSGVRPGDEKLRRCDGANAWFSEQRRNSLPNQFLQLRRVADRLSLQRLDSPRYLPEGLARDAGLDVCGCAPKADACIHELLTFESDKAVVDWLWGSHDQCIELIESLAGRGDHPLSCTQQNSDRLSVAALTWNRVVLST